MLSKLLSHVCVFCQRKTVNHFDLCLDCKSDLPWLHHYCRQCALPLSTASNKTFFYCSNCLKKPPFFIRTFAPLRYEFPTNILVSGLKFNHRLLYASLLAQLMIPQLVEWYQNHALPEALIPVPLHDTRLRRRGFNQALEISKPLAKKFNLPIMVHHCIRQFPTLPQANLTADKRQKNINQAFQMIKSCHYRHIAIVDDVMTTGATVNELAKVLILTTTVDLVEVWCCARTPNH